MRGSQMTCDEAWPPTTEIELSARKQAILEQAEHMATERDLWRSRNAAFYASDLAYMRFLIPEGSRVLDLGCGTGALLAGLKPSRGVGIDFSSRTIEVARRNHPSLEFHVGDVESLALLAPRLGGPFDFVILSDTLGYLDDCQAALEQVHDLCDASTRIVIVYYSHLWEPVLRLGEAVGLRMPQPEVNFLGHLDIQNILRLADFETIKQDWRQLLPVRLFGLGTLINRFVGPLPIIRRLCLRYYLVARSMRQARRASSFPAATSAATSRTPSGSCRASATRLK
jgi:SAM-dependent methyltransferase